MYVWQRPFASLLSPPFWILDDFFPLFVFGSHPFIHLCHEKKVDLEIAIPLAFVVSSLPFHSLEGMNSVEALFNG